MTEERFQQLVKWGGVVLALVAVANIYYVLRYREAHRDYVRIESGYPQQLAMASARQQALEAVIRDFATRATAEPGLADILRRHGLVATNPPAAKP